MLKSCKLAAIAASVLLTAACTTPDPRPLDDLDLHVFDLAAVRDMQPHGPAFVQGLRAGYIELADYEQAQFDYSDSYHFGRKAVAVARGVNVLPDQLALRELDEPASRELGPARARLLDAYDRDARRIAPLAAARAQVAFDCWLEAAEVEGLDRTEECRTRFQTAMNEVEDALASGISNVYLVFFAFDRADITPAARKVIEQAAEDFKKGRSARLVLAGHADRAGPAAYNMKLSERRAKAVAAVLLQLGVPEEAMELHWYGETRPRVETPDGVPEPQNRRVEISLE